MNRMEKHARQRTALWMHIVIAIILTLGLGQSQGSVVHAQWTTPDTSNNINSTNSGNVGIGTTDPTGKLHTSGVGNQVVKFESTSAASEMNLIGSGGNWYIGTGWASAGVAKLYFYDHTAGLTRAVFDDKGNIGLGVAAPSVRLHLTGNNTSSGGYPAIKLQNTETNGHSWWLYSGAWGVPGAFGIYDETVGSYRMFFDGAGKVGIGTANPLTKLAVSNGGGEGFEFDPGFGSNNNLLQGFNRAGGVYTSLDARFADYRFSIGASEKLRIDTSGKVGIGTASPLHKLTLGTGTQYLAFEGAAGVPYQGLGYDSTLDSGNGGLLFKSNLGTGDLNTNMVSILRTSGNVGIGTASPVDKLDVRGGIWSTDQFVINGGSLRVVNSSGTEGVNWTANTSGGDLYFRTAGADRLHILNNGNVGVGTTNPTVKLDVNGAANIAGNLTATGTITGGTIEARYQDVAEWVPATHTLPAGTVVILNPDKTNEVMASNKAYDTRVAGVISERPGLALGVAGKDKVLVATTGRVKVKVDATRSPIKVGDLLVTSDVEGVAIKSEPLDLGGAKIHRPGTLLGKALEPLEKGSGEILVLLSLQ